MTQTITGLSRREAELLAWLASTDRPVFRLADVQEYWPAESASTAARMLGRLEQGGWLRRIERGLYMVLPLEAGPERIWTQDSLVIGTRLVEPSAVAYWSAFRYWNLTEQLPRTVFIQTPRRKARMAMTIDGVSYRLIHISASRFFGSVTSQVSGQAFRVTDREKTIIDALDRPDLSGGIWQVAQAIAQNGESLDWTRLDEYVERFASGAVLKRLGYLVETVRPEMREGLERVQRWQSMLTEGVADLDPSEKGQGIVRRRWHIRDNIGFVVGWKGGADDR